MLMVLLMAMLLLTLRVHHVDDVDPDVGDDDEVDAAAADDMMMTLMMMMMMIAQLSHNVFSTEPASELLMRQFVILQSTRSLGCLR